MFKFSTYILTNNSEKYLVKILDVLSLISDKLLIIDSRSTDNTERISLNYPKAKFIYHKFNNFRDQRIFAEEQCTNDMILFLDSDKIPDTTFIHSIQEIKNSDSVFDVYRVARIWHVLGKAVHCIYPVSSPDNPIRLYNKKIVSFIGSQLIYETQTGYSKIG